MEQNYNYEPALVPSVSDDDYEAPNDSPRHDALIAELRSGADNKEAMAFLLRYEAMIRQQEAEDVQTLAYLRPCIERIEELAGTRRTTYKASDEEGHRRHVADSTLLARQISFCALKRALKVLDEKTAYTDSMLADRQLMMVLKLLTQKTAYGRNSDYDHEDEAFITWAEVLQAYKTCIIGMFTLQHLPTTHPLRNRVRDRTVTLLSLFEGPACQLFSAENAASDNTPSSHTPKQPKSTRRNRRKSNCLKVAAIVAVFLMGLGGGLFVAASSFLSFDLTPTKEPTDLHSGNSCPALQPSPILEPTSPLTSGTEDKAAAIPSLNISTTFKTPTTVLDGEQAYPSVPSRRRRRSMLAGAAFGVVLVSTTNMFSNGTTVANDAIAAAEFTIGLSSIIAGAVFPFVGNLLHPKVHTGQNNNRTYVSI